MPMTWEVKDEGPDLEVGFPFDLVTVVAVAVVVVVVDSVKLPGKTRFFFFGTSPPSSSPSEFLFEEDVLAFMFAIFEDLRA